MFALPSTPAEVAFPSSLAVEAVSGIVRNSWLLPNRRYRGKRLRESLRQVRCDYDTYQAKDGAADSQQLRDKSEDCIHQPVRLS